MTPHDDLLSASACANCGTALSGPWCSRCGQRAPRRGNARAMVELQARRIAHTLFALLCRPGLLTVEFCGGQRARSIAPWRLLFNAVTIFFLLALLTDFRVAAFAQHDASGKIARAIAEVAARSGVDATVMGERLDRRFNAIYTILIALSVASYALVAAATHWRPPRAWSVHAIFATHFVAWLFVATMPYVVLMRALRLNPVAWSGGAPADAASLAMMGTLMLWMYGYVALAFRRVYGDSTPAAMAKAAVAVLVGVVIDNVVIALSFVAALRSL